MSRFNPLVILIYVGFSLVEIPAFVIEGVGQMLGLPQWLSRTFAYLLPGLAVGGIVLLLPLSPAWEQGAFLFFVVAYTTSALYAKSSKSLGPPVYLWNALALCVLYFSAHVSFDLSLQYLK